MRSRGGTEAASPLTVILVFVAWAVVLTAITYALVFDRPVADVEVVEVEEDGRPAFDVVAESGSLQWKSLEVHLIDRAGTDQSGFLRVPSGSVDVGDRLGFEVVPPAGGYLLTIGHKGTELVRLALEIGP